MASLHGVLLSLILFFNSRLRSKANRYLAFAILASSVVLSLEIVYYFDIEYQLPEIIQYAPIYWRTAIPVGIFYFALFLINPDHRLSKIEKLGFLLIGLEIAAELLYIPVNVFAETDAQIEFREAILVGIEQFIGLFACFWFFSLAIKKINTYQKYLFDHYSTTTGKSLAWLQSFLWLNIILSVLWLISYVLGFIGFYDASEFTYFLVTMGLALLSFFIGYFLILQYNWFQVIRIKVEEEEVQKTKLSSKADGYYDSLLEMMKEEKLYTDVELTLQFLSEKLNISSSYLSRIINEKENKNFFEFVNTYRVDEVKEKLVDKEYDHYSIFGIALESGFKSKSTFNTVFKKFTGQTPSSYQRQFS